MRQTGNTILLTGGGSGIGRELARRFNALGNHVIVAGRRQEALDETIGGRSAMSALTVDVEDLASLDAFAERVLTVHPDLNVVINNAGVMRHEDISGRRSLSDSDATIRTNLMAPIHIANAFVDHLRTRPDAVLVNVTSGLAFVPLVATPTYSATKAALHSYTLSLRHQLAGEVEVIELVPPGVQTDLTPGQATREGYMPLDAYIDEVMTQFARTPTPAEILVDRVSFLRSADREGRFDAAFTTLNPR